MRYTGPKARRVRRQGVNIFGSDKYDRILQRKPYAPGMQAAARMGRGGKISEYGKQLLEKQKVCYMYGVLDRGLRAIYREASRTVGQTDTMIHTLLERRLDNVLYRAGFAKTRMQSRQFISHGLFTVNGVRVTIPSYQVEEGDVIRVREQRKLSPVFAPILAAHERYTPPDWLKVDPSALNIEVRTLPTEEKHFEKSIDMRKVIGFYSR
jgi:small subunit ribosomal protein S4